MILEAKVSLVKTYGLIMDLDNKYTGLVLQHNCLTKDQKKKEEVMVCRVLDIDTDKQVIDLQEVKSHSRNYNKTDYLVNKMNKYKLNEKDRQWDAKVVLQKEQYCVVELVNQPKVVGFLGLQKVVGEIVKGIQVKEKLGNSRTVFTQPADKRQS